MRFNGAHSAVFGAYLDDLGLLYAQILLILERELHYLLIFSPVGLRTQRVNSRPLAAVEHTVLYAGLVGCLCHLAAQSVQLTHEMPLARAAYGGIAGHIAHAVEVYGKAYRVKSHACGGKRGLYSRVTCADDGYIAFSGIILSQFRSPLNHT